MVTGAAGLASAAAAAGRRAGRAADRAGRGASREQQGHGARAASERGPGTLADLGKTQTLAHIVPQPYPKSLDNCSRCTDLRKSSIEPRLFLMSGRF